MDPLRLAAIVGLVVLIVAVALVHRRRRATWTPKEPVLALARLPVRSAAPLHLVVFTSPLCSDCHEAPRIALEAAPEVPLLTLDVRDHPALASRVGIHTTPTFLLVDEVGRIRWTQVGLPDPTELWLYVREAWDSTPTVRALHAERTPLPVPQR